MKKMLMMFLVLSLVATICVATSDTSGFYRLEDNEGSDATVLYAREMVYNAEYQLHRANKDDYEYPVYGWFWFDTKELAYEYFDIELPEEDN